MTDSLLQRQQTHTQEAGPTPAVSRQVGKKPVEAAQGLDGLPTIQAGLQMSSMLIACVHDLGIQPDCIAADAFIMPQSANLGELQMPRSPPGSELPLV